MDMIVIRTVQGELSAHLVKSRLESAGIPALLQFETYLNLSLALHAPISISVPAEFSDDARELVKDASYDLIMTIPKKTFWIYSIIRAFSIILGGR